MRQRNRHIILLAWVQVILLLFPTVVKVLHRHAHEVVVCSGQSQELAFSHPVHSDSCPICDFEFVQFVPPSAGTLLDAPVAYCKQFSISLSFVTVAPVILPSLRAPPVC